jgi:hypothetical protein
MNIDRNRTRRGPHLAFGRLVALLVGRLGPPRFARYLPSARQGTRRLERRLLRRLDWLSQETAR